MARYICLLVVVCFTTSLLAQIPKPDPTIKWKKRLKTAHSLYEEGYYASAGEYYKSVLKDKPTKSDVAYKAGESFLKVRDYNNAVSVLRLVKDKNKDFDKVGLKYAIALKQSGEYEQAIKEFEFFINNYKGSDFDKVQQQVQTEIEGCLKAGLIESADVTLEYISQTVNSPTEEFAPIPFNDDILYFSSDFEGKTQIYRTLRRGTTWTRPKKPTIFTGMEKEHFGNGAFTPDRTRFYFTQCDNINSGCQIYMLKREGRSWSAPILLPEEINSPSANSTHPYVTVVAGKEIIYFSSDRSGGEGGMDLWYTIREFNSENFAVPVNLGSSVNTPLDEVTPYYDVNSQNLYFSSKGHVNVGGFDVYKTTGNMTQWGAIEHLSLPFNSSADDMYFILADDGRVGFFTSNRLYEDRKSSTQDNDLYRFEINEEEILVRGNVTDLNNPSAAIGDVIVVLHEITSDGRARKLDTKIFSEGVYQLLLLPNRKYRIEIEKSGYQTESADLNTSGGQSTIIRNIALVKTTPTPPITMIDPKPTEKTDPIDKTNFPPPPGKIDKPITSNTKTDDTNNTTTTDTDVDKFTPPGGKPITTTTEPVSIDPEPVKIEPAPTRIEPEPIDITPTPPLVETDPFSDKPQKFKLIGERDFSTLNTLEIDRIVYFDGEPYLKTPDGFYLVTNVGVSSTDDNTTFDNTTTTTADVDVDNSVLNPPLAYGSNYKIQLAAVSVYKPHKFKDVGSLGEIQIEELDNGIKRVLVSSFDSVSEARRTLAKLKARGYDRAFIAKYENGVRVGRPIKN